MERASLCSAVRWAGCRAMCWVTLYHNAYRMLIKRKEKFNLVFYISLRAFTATASICHILIYELIISPNILINSEGRCLNFDLLETRRSENGLFPISAIRNSLNFHWRFSGCFEQRQSSPIDGYWKKKFTSSHIESCVGDHFTSSEPFSLCTRLMSLGDWVSSWRN